MLIEKESYATVYLIQSGGNEFSGSMLETGLSLNRVTTVGEQMLEGLRSLDRNQESIGKGEREE